MSQLEVHDTAWADLAGALQGNGATQPKSARALIDREQERQRWQDAIDHWRHKWAQNPNWLEDEGIVAPSGDIIQLASQVAGDLRDAGVPGPHRVAATGD